MDPFCAITDFPDSGALRKPSDTRVVGLEIKDCCAVRQSAGDGFAHVVGHHIRDVKGDAEEVLHLTVDSLLRCANSGQPKKFAEHRRTFNKEHPAVSMFLTPHQLKKAVAGGDNLLDPVGVHAVAAAVNKHIGLVFQGGEMWTTRLDGNFWKCEVQCTVVSAGTGFVTCMPVRLIGRRPVDVKKEIKIKVDPAPIPAASTRARQRAHDFALGLLERGARARAPTATVSRAPPSDSDDDDQEVATILEHADPPWPMQRMSPRS